MLIPRIITAVALLAVLLPALFSVSPEPFAAVTLLLIVAASWEWGRLNQMGSLPALGVGLAVGIGLAGGWWGQALAAAIDPSWERSLWLLVSTGWVLGSAALVRAGVNAWMPLARSFRLAVGWLLLAATWWAMARARTLGINFLLSLMVLVWAADVAAYFGGRAWGKRKLAAAISPGKTWAGAWSGAGAVLVLGIAWQRLDETGLVDGASIFMILADRHLLIALIGVLFLVAMAVVGDLMESLVKRSAGVKDSSGLLPGHGGVLDRVDALLPVLPIGMMLVTV
jgi:phosphatidate cytidylyltransferase